MAASRASRIPSLGSSEETPTSVIYGPISSASFARWDPQSLSWRTLQASLLSEEGWQEFSESWPRSGMTRSGRSYRLRGLGLHTSGSGSGLWPTPVANDDNKSPEAHMAMKRRMKGGPRNCITSLQVMVKATETGSWPTPRAEDSEQTGGHRGRADALTSAARLWPTPKGRDWKGQIQRGIHAPKDGLPNMDRGYGKPVGGALNPTWVEWLMGWPFFWTDLNKHERVTTDEWISDLRAQASAACLSDDRVRSLWWDEDPASSPRGPRPDEQQPGECECPVCEVPCGESHQAGGLGLGCRASEAVPDMRDPGDDTADPAGQALWQSNLSLGTGQGDGTEAMGCGRIVPRVAQDIPIRVDRLRTIGNGWVPHVAAYVAGRIQRRIERVTTCDE